VHKFKKYYVKLLIVVFNVALTNAWIYYSLVNPEAAKKSTARADFFHQMATQMVRQDVDWVEQYESKTRGKMSPIITAEVNH
jgi:hypothetical protein